MITICYHDNQGQSSGTWTRRCKWLLVHKQPHSMSTKVMKKWNGNLYFHSWRGHLNHPAAKWHESINAQSCAFCAALLSETKLPIQPLSFCFGGGGGAIELNTTNVPIRFNILRGDTVCVVWFLLVQVFACSSCFWGHNWRLCDRQEIMLSNQSSRSSSVISCLTELESGGAISFSLASSIFSSFGTSLTASQSEVWKKTSVKALSPPPR